MCLDAVGSGDRLAGVEDREGATEPDPRQLTIVDESASVGQPGLGEQIESFVQAAFRMSIEIGGAPVGIGASATGFAIGAALPPVRGTASGTGVVNVADDGGEVAIADTDLAAAGVGTKPALGLVEVFERVAAKRPHECVGRAGHCVLGVSSFQEEPSRAILGASAIALVLDDRTEHVWILAVERMSDVTTSGGVDAQEGGDEQRGDVAREHWLLE